MTMITIPTHKNQTQLSVETVNEELSLGTKNIKRVTIELVINDHKITSGTGITRHDARGVQKLTLRDFILNHFLQRRSLSEIWRNLQIG
jgi:hypothetical protein